jgi:DNA-binding PadR family transcriptional regulator
MSHGHGREMFMRHGWGPGPRVFERGGIKFAILVLLKDKPRYGYDIIRAMEEQSGGMYSPSPGAVYPTLQALEEQDLVTSTIEEGKKVYSVTEAGTSYLEEHKEEVKSHEEHWAAHWGPGGHGEARSAMSDVKESFVEVMRAIRSTAGDPAKRKEIREVLEEATKKVGDIAKR